MVQENSLAWSSRGDAVAWQEGPVPQDTTLADTLPNAFQPCVYPDTPIGVIADIILQTGNGRVPVVAAKDHTEVGIVTRHDLLKARHSSRKEEISRSRTIGWNETVGKDHGTHVPAELKSIHVWLIISPK